MIIEKIKGMLNFNENKKNVARISIGTMIGQVISFMTLPVLTRIYGAQIIGTWTLINSIALIVNSFSDFGLSNAIMLEQDEENMTKVYRVVSTLVLFFSFIGSVFVLFYYKVSSNDAGLNKYFLCIFMFVAIFTLQQIQVCYTWLNRKAEYKVLMKNPIINNAIFGFIAIFLGIVGIKQYGYFIGWILGQIITLLHMKRKLPKAMITTKINDFKEVFNKYSEFIKYQMPTNVASNIKNQIPVFGIRILFGETILGYYSVVVRIMQIPISLLANAMGRVFFQTVTDMKRKGQKIGNYVFNNINSVTKVAAIPLIVIIAVGDYLAIIFLGSEWRVAGDFMRIVVFQNYFMFLMSTVQGIAITLEKQRLAMLFCIIQSIGFIMGLCFGKFVFNNEYIGVFCMSMAFVICNIIYFCILFKFMDVSPKKYLKSVLSCVIFMTVIAEVFRMIINMTLDIFNIII